MVWSAGRSSSS